VGKADDAGVDRKSTSSAPNNRVVRAEPFPENATDGLNALVLLTEALARHHDIHDILFLVVSRLAELLRVDRGSIVLREDGVDEATVVVTSDDQHLRNLPIFLGKYPELRQVFETNRPLVIDDVHDSPLLSEVLIAEGPFDFATMAIVPISGETGPLALLILKGHHVFGERQILEARAVANATAIALNNARILGILRAESRRTQAETRRRLNELSRYEDIFESSSDAMAVMNRTGTILFANPALVTLTGRSAMDLEGSDFGSLFPSECREQANAVVAGFALGHFPQGVDFEVRNQVLEERFVSISFSNIVRDGDTILASLRDVTFERELAVQLAQTKKFLERVIDASMDGIVSADLKGNVLLFNRAAGRIFGYDKSEVIGRLTTEQLYPEGVARDLMNKLRSPEFGGYGRIDAVRVDLKRKDETLVPVHLSVSFVVEGTKPVATLGVITDITEKVAMERRLEAAHREIQDHEKTAAIAAFAGTAAHELNQPLTAILGYAEILHRSLTMDPKLDHATRVILSETERMAEIVRKLSRVTRYETKDYVGGAKILDLDRASSPLPDKHGQ
jgi:PAS domain S-box-containing protein